ncbi:MAG: hypothetical protein WBW99_18610 [Pseudolabrys sp.]
MRRRDFVKAIIGSAAGLPCIAHAQLQAQQAPLSSVSQPLGQELSSVKTPVRGVTDTEIRFGISAPFSGSAKELGQNMQRGIEAAFRVANTKGGCTADSSGSLRRTTATSPLALPKQ